MINVTKSFLPPYSEYSKRIEKIWETAWLTNHGPNVTELEKQVAAYLGVKHCFFTGNGTIAIQIALKALGISKKVITTPFSYVATTTSILWEHCTPIFVDINNTDFNIDVTKIEQAITPDTEAILAVHVYGNPCDVEVIEAIANKHNLKIIYDGAHAFGAEYKQRAVLNYGDISTCSFHATKIFHTIEGGAILTNDDALVNPILLYRSFGHIGDDYYSVGINGKNCEFHAAMGLCNLPYLEHIIHERKKVHNWYVDLLAGLSVQMPKALPNTTANYSYFSVVFKNEQQMLDVKNNLAQNGINSRRYFYPSLNKLSYVNGESCPLSEEISNKVLSLPLFVGLQKSDVENIVSIIKQTI
jgi:dTDP-4-amino-4,6-dideoxygalactose transaminase